MVVATVICYCRLLMWSVCECVTCFHRFAFLFYYVGDRRDSHKHTNVLVRGESKNQTHTRMSMWVAEVFDGCIAKNFLCDEDE